MGKNLDLFICLMVSVSILFYLGIVLVFCFATKLRIDVLMLQF